MVARPCEGGSDSGGSNEKVAIKRLRLVRKRRPGPRMSPLPRGKSRLRLLEFLARHDRLVVALNDLPGEHEVARVGRIAEHVTDPRAPRAMRSLLEAIVPSQRAVLVLENPMDQLRHAGAPLERRSDSLSPVSLEELIEHCADLLGLRFVDEPLPGAPPLALRRGLGPPVAVGGFLTQRDRAGRCLLRHADE